MQKQTEQKRGWEASGNRWRVVGLRGIDGEAGCLRSIKNFDLKKNVPILNVLTISNIQHHVLGLHQTRALLGVVKVGCPQG